MTPEHDNTATDKILSLLPQYFATGTPDEQVHLILNVLDATLQWMDSNLTADQRRSLLNRIYMQLIGRLTDAGCVQPNSNGRVVHTLNPEVCIHGNKLTNSCLWCDAGIPF